MNLLQVVLINKLNQESIDSKGARKKCLVKVGIELKVGKDLR
jgi:hypothetical protein